MRGEDLAALAIAGNHASEALWVTAIVFGTILLMALGVPALVMNYRLKTRALAAAESQDSTATKGLWDTARRMEERIGYLEQVLDTEVPGWRNRSNVR